MAARVRVKLKTSSGVVEALLYNGKNRGRFSFVSEGEQFHAFTLLLLMALHPRFGDNLLGLKTELTFAVEKGLT